MKTTFGRLFALSAALIGICLVLIGVAFRLMLGRSLAAEKRQTLQSNADILVDLTAAYDAMGELDHRWDDFHICLTAVAEASGSEILLCREDGSVQICSCHYVDCPHINAVVDPDFASQVIRQGELFQYSDLSGLYESEQFVEAACVRSHLTDEIIGVIIVTAPRSEITELSARATTIFFYVSVLVLIVALIACYLLSRTQARSIQTVTRAANRFGHGDLEARVPVGGKNTEEVDELAVAFNTMAEDLAKSERQRKEFVANISHELKTPMTTIAGFMDGMLDGTIPKEQHRHYMQLVSDEVRRLSRLVRSMLEISRLQSQGIGEEKKRRFDLSETIGQVLISFEQRVTRKGIHVDVRLPDRSVWVKADPDSITQVIYNLTDNAIKFCNENGILIVHLTTEGSKAVVTIENSGKTIDPEELPLIFDRFHKADKSRSADPEGVGLGLYIVKTILNSHGEDIFVTSENDVTAFTFTLPLVR